MKVREIPQIAIEHIRRDEGVRLRAYKDVAGLDTIGIGHLIRRGEVFPEEITMGLAGELLRKDLLVAGAAIMRLITVPLTDNQYSALLSFCFNIGSGALQASTLRSMLNREEYTGAAEQFSRWCFAGGRKIKGLYLRRLRERELFLS